MKLIFQRYLEYFENLTPERVSDLRRLAAADLRFVDPFNDVRSVEAVMQILCEMFRQLKEVRFAVTDTAESGDTLFVRWDFHFAVPLFRSGKQQRIEGVSFIRSNSEGKISEHLDYWDASTQIYRHIPLVGLPIRALRRWIGVRG